MAVGMIGGYGAYGYAGYMGVSAAGRGQEHKAVLNPGQSQKVQPGKKSSPAECQTCRERKYVDGSNESDVSFKTPTHIGAGGSTGAVMAHEQMHVANAYQEEAASAGKNTEAEVVSCNVSIKYAVCPECGRSYAAGGETATTMRYTTEQKSSPYIQNAMSFGAANGAIGGGMDISA